MDYIDLEFKDFRHGRNELKKVGTYYQVQVGNFGFDPTKREDYQWLAAALYQLRKSEGQSVFPNSSHLEYEIKRLPKDNIFGTHKLRVE